MEIEMDTERDYDIFDDVRVNEIFSFKDGDETVYLRVNLSNVSSPEFNCVNLRTGKLHKVNVNSNDPVSIYRNCTLRVSK